MLISDCFVDFKENKQRELIEKKRAEREQQKLKKKRKLGNGPQEEVDGLKEEVDGPEEEVDGPEEEGEDIIDYLMKVIREGKALRCRSEAQSGGTILFSRFECALNQDDILKAYEQFFAEPITVKSKDATDGELFSGYKSDIL